MTGQRSQSHLLYQRNPLHKKRTHGGGMGPILFLGWRQYLCKNGEILEGGKSQGLLCVS
jgi:hypothetical protein